VPVRYAWDERIKKWVVLIGDTVIRAYDTEDEAREKVKRVEAIGWMNSSTS
jgi:hypothetical protein